MVNENAEVEKSKDKKPKLLVEQGKLSYQHIVNQNARVEKSEKKPKLEKGKLSKHK
jgi:uncharacterized membrane protein YcaP (DUF421 family)